MMQVFTSNFLMRLLVALVLGVLLAYCFWRSWKEEHGTRRRFLEIEGIGETTVWISPLAFPIIIGGYLAFLLVVEDSPADGILCCMEYLCGLMIHMSLYFLVLLLFLPLLRKHFSAHACAVLWLVPVFLWFTNILEDTALIPLVTLYIPTRVILILGWIWLAGFVAVLGVETLIHFHFKRKILRDAEELADEWILDLWHRERKEMEYQDLTIRLLYSPAVKTPLSIGVWGKNRCTLLPKRDFTEEELTLIFRHELHHLQRRDVDSKVFMIFSRALMWFNPLMWIAVRKASDDLELSCDEIVLADADSRERMAYAELILNTAGSSIGFSTCLSGAAASLRYRLKNIVTPGNCKIGVLLLAAVMILCTLSYGMIGISCQRGTVGSLILTEETEIRNVSSILYYDKTIPPAEDRRELEDATEYERYTHDMERSTGKQLDYLKNLPVERIFGRGYETLDVGDNVRDISYCIGTKDDELYISLSDQVLTVISDAYDTRTSYLLREPVDWEYIRSLEHI